jgi:Flp pilus assembly protein TadG
MTDIRLSPGMASFVSALWKDTRGVILPYVTVLLVVFIGVSLLALDGARYVSSQTQMQSDADALALAGAQELDNKTGAILRATAAINNLLSNQSFGMGVAPAIVLDTSAPNGGITFYSALPRPDQPLSAGTVAIDDYGARFVAVSVVPQSGTVPTIFPVSYLMPGWTNGFAPRATAVAGRDLITCNQTPMWICNPFETTNPPMSYEDATAALENAVNSPTCSVGKFVQLQLAQQGQYSPGNFGWVSPNFDTSQGACGAGNPVTQTVSRSTPQQCFAINGMDTQTGNIQNANDGINTRFDVYNASFSSCKNNPLYGPATNVRKGWIPGNNACNPPAQNAPTEFGDYRAMGFPVDNNMIDPNTGQQDTSVLKGDGTWACGDITTTDMTTGGSVTGPSITLTGDRTAQNIFLGMPVTCTDTATGSPCSNFPDGATSATTAYVTSVTNTGTPGAGSTTVTVDLQASTTVDVSGDTIAFGGYWNTAHPVGTTGHGSPPTGCTASATISRDSVVAANSTYKYEDDNNYEGDASRSQEVGNPTCSGSTPDPKRREINVAIVNCKYLEANGYNLQGHSDGVPVTDVATFFFTNTINSNSTPIYGEFKKRLDPTDPNDGLHISVQLYR